MSPDLYSELLHLPAGPRPPHHYAILGLPLFEPDPRVIHEAVLRQTAELKRWQLDPRPGRRDRVQAMLNEVSRAGLVLEDPGTKADYDAELARQLRVPLPPAADLGDASVSLAEPDFDDPSVHLAEPDEPMPEGEVFIEEREPARAVEGTAPGSGWWAAGPLPPARRAPKARRSPLAVGALVMLASAAAASLLLLPRVRSWLWPDSPTRDVGKRAKPSTKILAIEEAATGELKVVAEPPGATVWLDGERQGTVKPDRDLRLTNVPVGPHHVRVSMDAYEAEEKSVEVKRGTSALVELRARPLPRLTLEALWAAAKAGDRPKMEACFTADALARLRETDQFISQNAANLPDGLKRATVFGRLAAAAASAAAPPQAAPETLQADRAAADVKWPWGTERAAFARETGAWKLAPPFLLADRLKSEAEEALRLAAAPVRARVEDLWKAAADGHREALLACFDTEARQKATQIDLFIEALAKQAPTLSDLRLLPALGRQARTSKIALGPIRIDGDKAALDMTLDDEKVPVLLAKEAGTWKMVLPFSPLDRVKAEAEAAYEAARARVRAQVEALWKAAADGRREALLACFNAEARQKAIEIDSAIEKLAQQAPKLDEFRLLPALARKARTPKIEPGQVELDGERATADMGIAGETDKLQLVKEAGGWRIALPFPEFDRIRKQAETEVARLAAEELAKAARARFDGHIAEAEKAIARGDYPAAAKAIEAARIDLPNEAVPQDLLDALEPTLKVEAEIGGVELQGAQITLNGTPQKQPTPATFRLEKGKTCRIQVTVPNPPGKRFTRATTDLTADWPGPRTWRAGIAQAARTAVPVYKLWPFDAPEARRRQERTARAIGLESVEDAVDLGNGVQLTLVLIPAGVFLMGSPPDEKDRSDNEDLHLVTITEPFWIGKHEVTQEQWRAVTANNPSEFLGAKNPVERVSWNDIQGFLQKLNQRAGGPPFALPTEAEWEYACRAGSPASYSFGDDEASLGQNAWYAENSGKTTHPVGEKGPNAWGLADLHGNVWEWCASPYAERYDGSEMKGAEAAGALRALRGGSWRYSPRNCRSAGRGKNDPADRFEIGGFRVVRPEKAPPAPAARTP